MPNLILITGATGSAGGALVDTLLARGSAVRAAARHIHNIPASVGVEAVRFDYSDPATFGPALEGVTGIFLVAPPMDPEAHWKLRPFIGRAADHGVRHLVFLSAIGVEQNEQAPLRLVEHAVMDSEIPWTILRPNFFMENFTSGFLGSMIRDQDGIFLAAGNGKTSFVSTRDIAGVAAEAFAEGGSSQEYSLTGPEALDHQEVAELISSVLDKHVTYHALSEEVMLQGARDQGMPESSLQYLAALYRGVRAGDVALVTEDVRAVTGRKPLSFLEFVNESRDHWQ